MEGGTRRPSYFRSYSNGNLFSYRAPTAQKVKTIISSWLHLFVFIQWLDVFNAPLICGYIGAFIIIILIYIVNKIANKIGIAKQMSVTKKPVLARIRISFISAIPAPPLSVEGYVPPPPDPPIYKVSREYLNI